MCYMFPLIVGSHSFERGGCQHADRQDPQVQLTRAQQASFFTLLALISKPRSQITRSPGQGGVYAITRPQGSVNDHLATWAFTRSPGHGRLYTITRGSLLFPAYPFFLPLSGLPLF